jgi:hypothetical protein
VLGRALLIYSRNRFILNLLPLLTAAPLLRRVVTVGAGTTEGAVDVENIDMHNLSVLKTRAQQTSIVTLSMESLAKENPTISFIHGYPGPVQSNLFRHMKGPVMTPMRLTINFMYRFYHIPAQETGERHVFMATSARWPPRHAEEAQGVEAGKDFKTARGTDGEPGSGCYCVTQPCEEGGDKHFALLKRFREDGTRDKVWKHIENILITSTGVVSI